MNFEDLVRSVECRHGRLSYMSTDTTIGRSLELYGEWAEAEVFLFQKLLQPGFVVLEAGANIGTHTIALAGLVGPTGWVHAFEPVYFTHQLLCGNIVANRAFNVQTYQATLGRSARLAEFPFFSPFDPDNFGAIGYHATSPRTTPCVEWSVDRLGLDRLDLLKLDVEGWEREAMEGASETIKRLRPLIFVESLSYFTQRLDSHGLVNWIRPYLEPLGYHCWHYVTPIFNPQNWRGEQADHFAGQWSFDLICVPRERGTISGLPPASQADAMFNASPTGWHGVQFHARDDAMGAG